MRAAFVLPLALALAGCLATPGEVVGPAAQADPARALALAGASGCFEGGGHSNYDRAMFDGILPAPWKAADVAELLGRPTVMSYGRPGTPEQSGIYHAVVVCDEWSLEGVAQTKPLVFGYVAVPVQAPPFDTGGADRHYLVDAFAWEDDTLRGRLADVGLHVSHGTGWIRLKDRVLTAELDDEHHGLYQTALPVKAAGAKPDEVVRLWVVQEDDEGKLRPRSVDLVDAGGERFVVEGTGAFAHSRTKDHEPLPGGYGNVAALAFTGVAREVRAGPAPDVVLATAWTH